ncbi:MAG: DNA polymerase III subunit beta [Proteobacteria bacterium]|nr:DNA polymerase III subunit beta [Pseudomonadota bacterium]
MEIKIARTEIMRGLGLVQSVVERKSTMPILTNVLLEAAGKNLSVTATDLEVGMNCAYAADVVENGRVTVHAKSLYDIVKELPDEAVHFKLKSGNRVEIKCGKSSFKIVGQAPDEFPALPKRGSGQTQKVEAKLICDMIDKTSFAMSSDETRYNLNGVYTDFSGGENGKTIQMVATDGHRLSVVRREVDAKWNMPKGGILPRKGVMELKRLMEAGDSPAELWADAKHLIAYRDNTTLVIRLIDGQFPPYEQVIPKKSKRVVSANRQELIHALKRVSVLSTDRSRGVRFTISSGSLDISASNPDLGEAREELSVQYKGDAFDIGFNARYFIDALNVIEDEQAALQLGDETSPCLVMSEFDRGFTHVIMPMRL